MEDDVGLDVRLKHIQFVDEAREILSQQKFVILFQRVNAGTQVVRVIKYLRWVGRTLRIGIAATYVAGPDGWAITNSIDGPELSFNFMERTGLLFQQDAWLIEHFDKSLSLHRGQMAPLQFLTIAEAIAHGLPVR